MRQRNLTLTYQQRATASATIFHQIEQLALFREARTIALFSALPDEPDTSNALIRWADTHKIVLPRVEGQTMNFYDYTPGALSRGAFGIAEPTADVPCSAATIDLIICPGVAFTPNGNRLGRGRGYYDRYLAIASLHAHTIGVAYAHQIVDALPIEPHDRPMELVVWDR
jgi:5-formyltetrahydrofolate cyclo-ligase